MTKALLHELGKSISFGRLPLLAKVLWPMMLASSDDQGRGLAEADAIKWYVCPNVAELTPTIIRAMLAEMVEQDMICLYADDRGRQIYQIIRWWEFQRLQWAKPSEYPAPVAWTDRIRLQRGKEQFLQGWDTPGGFINGRESAATSEPAGAPAAVDSTGPASDLPGEPPCPLPGQPIELELNSNQTKSSGAIAPGPDPPPKPPPKRRKPKTPTPAAVKAFREAAHRCPPKAWYDKIAAAVGEKPEDLAFWSEVVIAYVGQGWNPGNVANMLEFYERREIPSVQRNRTVSAKPERDPFTEGKKVVNYEAIACCPTCHSRPCMCKVAV